MWKIETTEKMKGSIHCHRVAAVLSLHQCVLTVSDSRFPLFYRAYFDSDHVFPQ